MTIENNFETKICENENNWWESEGSPSQINYRLKRAGNKKLCCERLCCAAAKPAQISSPRNPPVLPHTIRASQMHLTRDPLTVEHSVQLSFWESFDAKFPNENLEGKLISVARTPSKSCWGWRYYILCNGWVAILLLYHNIWAIISHFHSYLHFAFAFCIWRLHLYF